MCHLNNKDGKRGDKRMLISKYDKLYKDVDSADKALSTLDIICGATPRKVKRSHFIRKYSNPDMFYMDKTAGILPANPYITDSGKVYQIAV